MKKLMVINCCMRKESRTQLILTQAIKTLEKHYEIETIDIPTLPIAPLNRETLAARNAGHIPSHIVETASRIAKADRIVIAAPFWDMSFPSALKVFFENTSLYNITFTDDGKTCRGLCQCEKILYITTRGMDISTESKEDGATPYIKALSKLWGCGEVKVVSAQNMDYITKEEEKEKINTAIQEAVTICENF